MLSQVHDTARLVGYCTSATPSSTVVQVIRVQFSSVPTTTIAISVQRSTSPSTARRPTVSRCRTFTLVDSWHRG
ncbi:hypothetical protein T4E_6387 [Trichinella pseudospiralis]|uniref:Uncharacterized protein n=1 Tax=Trichinella pseudospiralis TaxID=6337 RepID=A0A0V0YM82_TRIPS|nr:hypothetical protein T4E_6387 [Trichinella pseudospiralis]